MQREDRIAVADGVRSISMLLILAFHLWQQSWLQNVLPSDLLRPIGIPYFSLAWVYRTGYMSVDVLLLLSGFCLFLPYARRMFDPFAREPDAPGLFYKKRAARILPCYYLVLLVYVLFWLRPSDYGGLSGYLHDVFAHLTFTQVFWPETYIGSHFPTALWTLSVEVQFYLLFPLIARVFRRFPLRTWGTMCVLAELYIAFRARLPMGGADSCRINQLPAMLAVYANGMLAAIFCCGLRKRKLSRRARWCAAGGAVFLLLAIFCTLRDGLAAAEQAQRWQIDYRFLFSAFVAAFLVLLDLAPRAVQFPFANRAVRFVAAISFNLYLWQQTVLLKLKSWHIPPYPAGDPGDSTWPQGADGMPWHRAWQWEYTALFWLVIFLLAVICTYGFERPVQRRILRRDKKQKQNAARFLRKTNGSASG